MMEVKIQDTMYGTTEAFVLWNCTWSKSKAGDKHNGDVYAQQTMDNANKGGGDSIDMNKESEGIEIHEAKTMGETILIENERGWMHVYM